VYITYDGTVDMESSTVRYAHCLWMVERELAGTYLIINLLVDVWQQIHMYVYFFGGRCIMFARES